MRTTAPVLVAAALVLAGLPACGAGLFASRCLPSRLSVTPDPVAAGEPVTVSSGPFECDAEYPPGTTYTLTLAPDGRPPVELGTAEVGTDGSFSTRVTVPATVPAGRADVVVRGSLFDDCDDAGSCAAYSVPVTVS